MARFYATCKQHKSPIKFRFITATNHSSIKPVAKILKHVFKTIQTTIIKNCLKKDKYRKDGVKTCIIIDNNNPVRENLFKINRSGYPAKSITSFDFDTLYTSIPHSKLITCIGKLIKEAFEISLCQYIRVTPKYAYFSNSDRKYSSHKIFKVEDVIELFKFMINNSYISFNNKVYRQKTGIPMGIDPAPYFANLFLHYFEFEFIMYLINSGDVAKARKLALTSRYLDDLLALNDENVFQNNYGTIYPDEMKLSRTDKDGRSANYLDMNLFIEDNKFLCSKLYDKRHEFPFKVINYPNIKYSNNPKQPSYGIFTSQLIRVTRTCTSVQDFKVACERLVNDFVNRGFSGSILKVYFQKFLDRYHRVWGKFGAIPSAPSAINSNS